RDPRPSLPASALLSALLPGTGRGARETVLGTLGKATILWIPPELQNLTLRFGAAVWKRDTEDPQRKLVLLKYADGNYTNYMENRTRFHKSDFSLEILNTRFPRQGPRQCLHPSPDTNLYLLPPSLSLEPVSDPSIHVLSWALANGSCTVTLNCTAARGDNVLYSWDSWDTSTSGLCSSSGSLLHFSYPLQNTSIACTCTASNSISSQVVIFNFSECSYEQGGKFPVADSALSSLLVLFLFFTACCCLEVIKESSAQEKGFLPLVSCSTKIISPKLGDEMKKDFSSPCYLALGDPGPQRRAERQASGGGGTGGGGGGGHCCIDVHQGQDHPFGHAHR
uniref:Ig-like domain-containing protein n=1 Tax=Bubo bubo TaxID=30461 RepID=A0A8C0E8J8_BUBBB